MFGVFMLINQEKIKRIDLVRDVTKHLKKGHRWIFADCFENKKFSDGVYDLFFKDQKIAIGIVQGDTQLRFRLLCLEDDFYFKKNSSEVTLKKFSEVNLQKAFALRKNHRSELNNSFRLINGEGDGLPGLIVDIYDHTAVVKHDHDIMEKIWNREYLADQICEHFPFVKNVYLKRRNDEEIKGEIIKGQLLNEVEFLENGLKFSSNIAEAAKTGFFLDQRDNRLLLSRFTKGKTVLNLFSYTGGFSLFAAFGGASSVTSVDIAKKAIEAAKLNFAINKFSTPHEAICEDAFLYIEKSLKEKKKFDIVITDPPSFAPNQKAKEAAILAYVKVYSESIKLVENQGIFIASSCSSHITQVDFLEILKEAFKRARTKSTVIYIGGQPYDHPYPLAMEELRYLKFAAFRLD